ncbi:MAG: Cof-type HAD-IIB family hydrolase [Acidobacteriia bacterium]|nr:Cof-type HAD-IIB family hydrolase [Terriglobia bacterium]
MKTRIRLLAVDIDGTLTDSRFKVPARNLAALQAVHAAGVQIMLATGRRHDYALPLAKELGVPVCLTSSNGALIRSMEGETFYANRLPARIARKLVAHMDGFRGHAVLTFDRSGHDSLVLERTDELTKSVSRWLEVNEPHIHRVARLEDALDGEDPIQAMYCGRVARMEEAQHRLAEAPFVDEFTMLRTQYDHRDLSILDILNQGCSKGHALRRWAEKQGVPRGQIMAIGDNYNDMEMLQFAGLPVVMGNAPEALRQLGWPVTATNEENGVAQALEEILGLAF